MAIDTMFNVQFMSALSIVIAIGAVAGYIGSLMISSRMSLMAGALGHLTLPGIAFALLYGFDVSIGAFIFLIIGIFVIWILEKYTRFPFEAVTAVVFTTFLAISFLYLPHKDINIALLGDISKITPMIAFIFVFISVIVFVVIASIYKKIVLIGISEDLACVEGLNVSKYNFIYLICIALVVAIGVRIIGGLMTAALVAIPALTSKNISRSLFQYSLLSSVFGVLSCAFGIILSNFLNFPVGPVIILCSTTFFLISFFIFFSMQYQRNHR